MGYLHSKFRQCGVGNGGTANGEDVKRGRAGIIAHDRGPGVHPDGIEEARAEVTDNK